jgi:hypothetical protein
MESSAIATRLLSTRVKTVDREQFRRFLVYYAA